MGMQYSRGLVAGYPFENTANDIMGVNNGTVNGATYVDGQCGRALSFDGIDDYVTLPNFAFIPSADNSSWSFSCWIKLPSTGALNTNGTLAILNLWQFHLTDNVNFYCGFRNLNTGTSGVRINYALSRNVWYHIVFVNKSGVRDIYINTVKQSLVPYVGTMAGGLPNTFSTNLATVRYFGILDLPKIRNKALTQSEIQRDYLNLPIF